MFTNVVSFGERILPVYDTSDIVLSNSMARSKKLRCCEFNKIFLIVVANDYVLVTLIDV